MKNVIKVAWLFVALALVFSTYSFAESGADIYKAKCAMCHGATGAGDTTIGKNLKVKDLGSAEVQKMSDEEIANTISKGKNKMPAYDGKLTKEQINDLVKFIRTLKK